MVINCFQPPWKNPTFLGFSSSPSPSSFLHNVQTKRCRETTNFKCWRERRYCGKRGGIVCGGFLPVDPWAPNIDSQSIASQLFAFSLFPYIGFLYFITKSKSAPKLTLFGFYFLLAFVGATIPAGIYAKVHEVSIVKVVWVPPEYGDGVACICADGTLSLWEEVAEDTKPLQWKLCKNFETSSNQVLDMQFGVSFTSLKLVAAYSNGHVKVYELLDPLELKNWQLQAEFQNVIDSVSKFGKAACLSASISWTPQRGESQQLSFVLGFNSNVMQLNSAKVWEFDQDHQRWLPVAELALPEDKGDPVYVVAWAPNIGRPYEVIAVATHKGITIWHLGLNPDLDGRLSVGKVALLSGHVGEVWQMEWDMSGMTLATTGSEGAVRLWQSNLNGIWHEQAAFEPTT